MRITFSEKSMTSMKGLEVLLTSVLKLNMVDYILVTVKKLRKKFFDFINQQKSTHLERKILLKMNWQGGK